MSQKQLILVRHAQAIESDDFSGSDFDRPLTDKGRESARIIARYLSISGVRPDFVVSSPAVRTKQTADIICEHHDLHSFETVDALYEGLLKKSKNPEKPYIDAINEIDESVNTLMVIGHNDDLTYLARVLADDGAPSMKKGGAMILALPEDMSWAELRKGELEIVYYLTPQFLRLELSCIHDR